MPKAFYLSGDGDPDLNQFDETDVERSFRERGVWFELCEGSLNRVDYLQRWMSRANIGDRRPLGKMFIVCVERIMRL